MVVDSMSDATNPTDATTPTDEVKKTSEVGTKTPPPAIDPDDDKYRNITVRNMREFRLKAPEVYDETMKAMAYSMTAQMRRSQDRVKEAMRKNRS